MSGNTPVLPWEVLSHIFVVAHASQSNSEPRLEVAVSQMNMYWREVAIHTPVLWSTINATSNKDWGAVECYLARSVKCRLDIRIYLHEHPSSIGLDAGEMGRALRPQIGRCRLLHVHGTAPFEALRRLTYEFKDIAAPLLEDLSIIHNGPDGLYPPLLFSRGAPALKNACLVDYIQLSPPTNLTNLHLIGSV